MDTKIFINNNRQIRYEFRPECSLVIFVDYNTRLSLMADKLEGCSQINYVDRVKRNEDLTGSLIVKLVEGYSEFGTIQELESVFNLFT